VLNFAGVTVDQVTSVTLTNLTHTYIADLAISLLHVESGQSVVLTSPPDDTAANFGGTYTFVVDPGLQTIDQVTRNTNTSFVVPTGSYAISDYAGEGGENGPRTDFTAFAGIPLSGTWRLSIEDFEVLGTGTLGSWSFAATTTSAAAIPEPGTLALLPLGALALAGAGAGRRRRRKAATTA